MTEYKPKTMKGFTDKKGRFRRTDTTKKFIIGVNKRLCEKRPEPCGLDDPVILDKILKNAEIHNQKETRSKLVNQSTEILAGMIFEQPFKNANKSTGQMTVIHFLKQHGYKIKDNSFKQLLDIEKKYNISFQEDNAQIYNDIRNFFENNLVKV